MSRKLNIPVTKPNTTIKKPKKKPMSKLVVKKIDFPTNQYYDEIQEKKQVVLHHTVSSPFSMAGDTDYWLSTKSRIATAIIVGHDGVLNQCFDHRCWAHHLGIKQKVFKQHGFKDYRTRNVLLNKESIAIEIDAWGGLTKKGGKFYNAYGGTVKDEFVIELPTEWRGYKYFQKYSTEQIEAVTELIGIYMKVHDIPKHGIFDGNIDVSMDALSSVPGIYSHTSFRDDKSDLYPDERLFKSLNTL